MILLMALAQTPTEITQIALPDVTTAIVVAIGIFAGLMGGVLNTFVAISQNKGDLPLYKTGEFLVTGFLAGFAGTVSGMYLGIINPWVLWLFSLASGTVGRPSITFVYDRFVGKGKNDSP